MILDGIDLSHAKRFKRYQRTTHFLNLALPGSRRGVGNGMDATSSTPLPTPEDGPPLPNDVASCHQVIRELWAENRQLRPASLSWKRKSSSWKRSSTPC